MSSASRSMFRKSLRGSQQFAAASFRFAPRSNSAICLYTPMAAIRKSPERRFRCRAASAAFSNTWPPTEIAAPPAARFYNAVYGLFEQDVEECVIESHISKLRKKLRKVLGYEIIDSKRFLGYRLDSQAAKNTEQSTSNERSPAEAGSFGQDLEVTLG